MAKDNLGLLNEISSQLKKLNQQSIRQDLQNKEYQERQLAQAAGGETAGQAPQIIDAAEDFKRRAKASIFSTKLSESVTNSGKRAKDTVKENKEKEKDRKREKKDMQLQAVRTADKRVGLSTVVEKAKELNVIEEDELLQLKLIKVNSDALVQMLGGIRTHLGMSQKSTEKARKAAIKAAMNAKRDKEEDRREDKKKEEKVVKMGKLGKFMQNGPQSPMGNNLMGMLLGGLIVGAGLAIKSMIDGFKAGGLKGAIKKLFFGNGEGGLGNAIAGAFKVGATFATAGLLIGGPVGALVGGIIGMAVGAFTGYFGSAGISSMLDSTGDYLKEKFEFIVFKVKSFGRFLADFIYKPGQKGNVTANDTKAQFFGQEISWTLTGIGTSIADAWNDGFAWLKEKIMGIALKIYDPTTNKVLGGVFTMPDWFDEVEEAVSKVWNGVKDFGKAIKNAVILLLPDVFTDYMGWTTNGMIVGAGSHHANYEAYNDGSNFGVTMAAASQVSAFQPAVKQQMDYINSFSSEGRRNRFDLSKINDNMMLNANGDLVPVYNNKMKTTGHSRIRGLSDESATELLRQRDMRLSMSGYGMRTGGVNITTDASNNTGAVIVNNNYMDSGGSSSSVDIHTHMTPVTGVYPPSMLPTNPFFKMAGQY